MKAFIIYFTVGGRTKKISEAIAISLSNYEVKYIPFLVKGKFAEKLKILDQFNTRDFTIR